MTFILQNWKERKLVFLHTLKLFNLNQFFKFTSQEGVKLSFILLQEKEVK